MNRLIISTLLVSAAFCRNYSNYKVYDVSASTQSQVKILRMWENEDGIDFWTRPNVNNLTRVMISPEKQKTFLDLLTLNLMPFELIVPDVEVMLRKENEENRRKKRSSKVTSVADATFHHFWTFDEMESYAKSLFETYPDIVELENIGKSFEGRNIFALKISSNLSHFGEKPIVFIDAGIHAREWASHACALYLIHQLATSDFSQEMLEKVDWVIIPNVNPDGYVYTHEEDRFWRKNRRVLNDSRCNGVDLNRNFPFGWFPSSRFDDGCSESYPGPSRSSEPETQAVAEYIRSFSHNLKLYVTTHSFSGLILWPWSFQHQHISNWREHRNVSEIFVEAVEQAGNDIQWEFGYSAGMLYMATGTSSDYAIEYGKARLSFIIELPPHYSLQSLQGFEYPVSTIERLVKEIFMGYRAMGRYVGETYYHLDRYDRAETEIPETPFNSAAEIVLLDKKSIKLIYATALFVMIRRF